MSSQITELYQVLNVTEGDPIKEGQLDPYALLYVSNKNREFFSKHGETFEEFVVDVADKFLKLAKEYYDEARIIPMIGRNEQINMAEFKHSEPSSYRIQVEPVSDDANTMLGKQLAINHIMQYASNMVNESNLGLLIKNMPMLNDKEMASELTINYDNCKNDFLAIERGEMPMVNPYDDHEYLISRTSNRMRKPDFRFLPTQVQQMYQDYLQQHEEMVAQAEVARRRADSGYIPVDGPLTTVDYYTMNAEGKAVRAKMPQRALEWLEQQLASQGTSLQKLDDMNPQSVGNIADQVNQMMGQGQMPQV
jgi:hypothetical protein